MGPFLRDVVNISLREKFIHKSLQYLTTKLETCAPIKLCALRVLGLKFRVYCKVSKGQSFLNRLYIYCIGYCHVRLWVNIKILLASHSTE